MLLQQVAHLSCEVLVVLQLCASHRLLEHRQPVEDGRILCLRLAQLVTQLLLSLLHLRHAAQPPRLRAHAHALIAARPTTEADGATLDRVRNGVDGAVPKLLDAPTVRRFARRLPELCQQHGKG